MVHDILNVIHAHLLCWYDAYQRHLPWRALSGVKPTPYHVWLSEIMLQQTTVATVTDYFVRFIDKWPTFDLISSASMDEIYHQWQGLGYYSRARNLHACAQKLSEFGKIPNNPQDLILLPGIGPYTAASIAAIAYDYPIVPVDGNITRVLARVFAITTPLPKLKNEIAELVSTYQPIRSGDFAQSMMDLGATICTPKAPKCSKCPIVNTCNAYAKNEQSDIPFKDAKPEKPTRYAYAYWIEDETQRVAFVKRPETGLLANLMSLPTSDWVDREIDLPDPDKTDEKLEGFIKHTFTHFHLIIQCVKTKNIKNTTYSFVEKDSFSKLALPTLMTKIINKYKINHEL